MLIPYAGEQVVLQRRAQAGCAAPAFALQVTHSPLPWKWNVHGGPCSELLLRPSGLASR